MTNQTSGTPNIYALLIGVDCYLPNLLPDGGWYPSLGGCVRDINHVEDYLRQNLGMTDKQILKLTATYTGPHPAPRDHDYKPTEPPEFWPTYENMVAKFKEIRDLAKPGDQIYIHYSGHGGRTTTTHEDLKGANGRDEGLVPTDIGDSKARYLDDVEIAHLLKTMVDKGLIVTVVFDSCHSGGATRGMGGAVPRGIAHIDTTPRPTASLVATPQELAATWKDLSGGETRALKPASGWLMEPQGYTLLAACRENESAFEFAFEGSERNGALTYWMLKSLRQLNRTDLSYKMLHDRILAKVHSQFDLQTPQLQGEGDRAVFGSDRVQPVYAVNVMKVEADRVRVNAGQAQGLRKGAQFAIYPPGFADFTQVDRRQALAEITELEDVNSWATITDRLKKDEDIEQGAQAVVLDPGNIKLQRLVTVFVPAGEAKAALEQAIKDQGGAFVRLAEAGQPAEFQVAIAYQEGEKVKHVEPDETVDLEQGEYFYQIWDSAGAAIRLRPRVGIKEEGAASKIAQRLVHLAKYRNVQELDNLDRNSPAVRALSVELLGVQKDYDEVDGIQPEPFADPGNTPVLQVDEWTFLRIRNNMRPNPQDPNDPSRILNITVMDMTPDWGVEQVYPEFSGEFEPLDPGDDIVIPLKASLPEDYDEGTDLIKVFATRDTTSFHWLELPALDKPIQSKGTRSAVRDPLEQMMAALAEDGPPSGTRTLNTYKSPSKGWATALVEVRLKKAGADASPV